MQVSSRLLHCSTSDVFKFASLTFISVVFELFTSIRFLRSFYLSVVTVLQVRVYI